MMTLWCVAAAALHWMAAIERFPRRQLVADCCRIVRHDLVLVKHRISLVTSNENARSGPMQLGGQVGW